MIATPPTRRARQAKCRPDLQKTQGKVPAVSNECGRAEIRTGSLHRSAAPDSRATPCTILPLHWWRQRAVADISPADLPMLRRCIRGFDMLRLPRWKDAERGDVAAAISVAFALVKAGRLACPSMTLPGTALLIAAVKGDAAAASVIAHLKKLQTAEAKLCAGYSVRGKSAAASASGNKSEAANE